MCSATTHYPFGFYIIIITVITTPHYPFGLYIIINPSLPFWSLYHNLYCDNFYNHFTFIVSKILIIIIFYWKVL